MANIVRVTYGHTSEFGYGDDSFVTVADFSDGGRKILSHHLSREQASDKSLWYKKDLGLLDGESEE